MSLRQLFLLSIKTFILISILFPKLVTSQDIHFSNNGIINNFINPANHGAFKGTIRASAVYKDQFSSFIENPYKTTMLSIDSPIAYGLSKNHWVGVGLQFMNDKAGDVSLQRNGFGVGAAYHISFDQKFDNVVTIGLNYSNTVTNLDESSADFGSGSDPVDLSAFDSQNNIAIGIKHKSKISKNTVFESGISVQRFFGTSNFEEDNKLQSRINFTLLLNAKLSKAISLTPEFYYSKSSNFSNISFHLFPEFVVGKKSDFSLRPGLGLRFGDAMIMHLGAIYKNWKVNLSYDMTVSSASVYTNNYGGFEIGLQRIFIIRTKPKTKLKLICPRL